jgi:hypothetical protein
LHDVIAFAPLACRLSKVGGSELKAEERAYYPREAYAGFLLRLMVELIDIVGASALCFLFGFGMLVGPFPIEPFTPLFCIEARQKSNYYAYFFPKASSSSTPFSSSLGFFLGI